MNPFQRLRDYFLGREEKITDQDTEFLRAQLRHSGDKLAWHPYLDTGVPDMILDGFQSATTGFGTAADKARQFRYVGERRLSNHILRDMYRSSGLIRTVVDLPINDMTRRGICIEHKEAKALNQMLETLNVMPLCNRSGKWGRAFRLGAVVMDIQDGRQVWEPVDVRRIKRVNLAFALDSTFILPYDMNWYKETSLYQLSTDQSTLIHRDRLLVFNGLDAGLENRMYNGGLYESVMDLIYQPFMNISADYNAASTLVKDFSIPVLKLGGFGAQVKQNSAEVVADIRKRASLMRRLLSIVNAVVIGETDSYENLTRTVQGFAELVKLAKEHFCFVSGIPHTKLFKEGPGSGLNNGKGESQDNDWDDIVLDHQMMMLFPELRKIVTYLGALMGIYEPIEFEFNPLTQLTEKQKAEISKLKAEALKLKCESAEIAMRNGWLSDNEIRANLFINQYGEDYDRITVETPGAPGIIVPFQRNIQTQIDSLIAGQYGNAEIIYGHSIAA